MVWRVNGPQGAECMKMLWELVPYTRGLGLDLGCGPVKAFPHFIGVDNRKDTGMFGIQMNPDLTVPDATKLPFFASNQWDFIFSSHLLEHVEDYKAALAEWYRLIKVGGHLCLYLPHKDFYPNIGKEGANPDHKHDFLPSNIVEAMTQIGPWDLLRNEDRNAGDEYSFFQVYKKLDPGATHAYSHLKPKAAKRAAVVRYGAWGDALQASSIFPELKKQGYHITLYSTPRAWEVISEHPDVDATILQDTDQVPNQALGAFWEYEKKKYDKWINLSESVEASWLVLRDRSISNWPTALRHKYLNANYVEFAHEFAELPYTQPNVKFYSTLKERMWAEEEKARSKAKPLILWVLNGSSVHKVWPHLDQIFSRIMLTYPEAKIVTVGDFPRSQVLDAPWANEPRVIRAAGQHTIRRTLALAEVCDLVVGPETGVLTAMSMSKMPKIVFLSHSSHENLTRDWLNTFALFSTKTKCYPCHKMHYSWDTCNQNKDTGKYWEGAAQCQVDIPPEACWAALTRALGDKFPVADLDKLVKSAGSVIALPAGIPFTKRATLPTQSAAG